MLCSRIDHYFVSNRSEVFATIAVLKNSVIFKKTSLSKNIFTNCRPGYAHLL